MFGASGCYLWLNFVGQGGQSVATKKSLRVVAISGCSKYGSLVAVWFSGCSMVLWSQYCFVVAVSMVLWLQSVRFCCCSQYGSVVAVSVVMWFMGSMLQQFSVAHGDRSCNRVRVGHCKLAAFCGTWGMVHATAPGCTVASWWAMGIYLATA